MQFIKHDCYIQLKKVMQIYFKDINRTYPKFLVMLIKCFNILNYHNAKQYFAFFPHYTSNFYTLTQG